MHAVKLVPANPEHPRTVEFSDEHGAAAHLANPAERRTGRIDDAHAWAKLLEEVQWGTTEHIEV